MSTGDLLRIQPSELKFPFELKKQSSCAMQLTNKTDQYVAFKVKTTNPRKYSVRPNNGVISPRSTCDVTVTMQAQKEVPPDMQCKDKFLLQAVVAKDGATAKDLSPEMFNKESGKVVEEVKLRVVYIPANPPSPVPEESEEGLSPTSSTENGNQRSFPVDPVVREMEEEPEERSLVERTKISKLTAERTSVLQQNQKLHEELELLRKERDRRGGGGFSLVFVALVGLLAFFVGFILKKK